MARARTTTPPRHPHGCHHPVFERRSWTAQRAAWVVMAAIVAAALLGAFGRGPISRRERATPDRSLVARFDRVVRAGAATRLEMEFDHMDESEAVVWLSNSYLDRMDLERSTPRARVEAADAGRTAFHFRAHGRAWVELVFRPRSAGNVTGELGLGPDPATARTLRIEHLVLP